MSTIVQIKTVCAICNRAEGEPGGCASCTRRDAPLPPNVHTTHAGAHLVCRGETWERSFLVVEEDDVGGGTIWFVVDAECEKVCACLTLEAAEAVCVALNAYSNEWSPPE